MRIEHKRNEYPIFLNFTFRPLFYFGMSSRTTYNYSDAIYYDYPAPEMFLDSLPNFPLLDRSSIKHRQAHSKA